MYMCMTIRFNVFMTSSIILLGSVEDEEKMAKVKREKSHWTIELYLL